MNFLAHCALARSHPDLMVGGYLGDFLKGPVPVDLPGQIGDGVRLHRRLDAYSAFQPDMQASVARLPGTLRRVGPVFIDLVADHFLARRFAEVEGQALSEFVEHTYAVLEQASDLYPAPAQRFLNVMRDHDLLGNYIRLQPVERAFTHIGARLGRPEIVAPAMAALAADYSGFEADFCRYYPDLKRHTDEWLSRASNRGGRRPTNVSRELT